MAFLSMKKFFILHFLHEKIKNSVLDFVNIIVYPDAKCLSYIFHIIWYIFCNNIIAIYSTQCEKI